MAALAVFLAALVFGMTEAHFKCNRNVHNSTHKNTILDLGKLLSLESLCMDVCEQSKCSLLGSAGGILGGVLGGGGGGPLGGLGGAPLDGIGSGLLRRRRCASGDCTSPDTTDSATQASTTSGGDGGETTTSGGDGGDSTTSGGSGGDSTTSGGSGGEDGGSPCSSGNGPCQGGSGNGGGLLDGVMGAATCLLPGGGNPNKISDYQSCLFPCILDLTLLDTCDVQAIITKVLGICPKIDLKGVCVSACLCCGEEEKPIDACVNLCLSTHGIDLNLSPLKILGLGGEDAVKAPVIDGFELPGLPLLPQLGLGGGSSAHGSTDGGSVSGGSSTGAGGSTGNGTSGASASGSGSASAGGSGSSGSSSSASASASSSSNSGSSSGSNGETTQGAQETTVDAGITLAATTASA